MFRLLTTFFVASLAIIVINPSSVAADGLRSLAEDPSLTKPVRRDCSSANPCNVCEGHCRLDADCAEGLICFGREQNTPIPGCDGHDPSHTDWCVVGDRATSEFPIHLIHPIKKFCSEEDPCVQCEGHCFSDNDCADGLICFHKDKGEEGVDSVPGCVGTDLSKTDWCTIGSRNEHEKIPLVKPVKKHCSESDPCDRCQGHCFDNSDCKGDLVCFQKDEGVVGVDSVPGCLGTDLSKTDWCTLQDFIDTTPCTETCTVIDFNKFPNGTAVPRGTYVNTEWKDAFGLEVSVQGLGGLWSLTNLGGRWWAPDGKSARIFDTSNPGEDIFEGDVDLGSPNEACEGGGPGVGIEGMPEGRGENCVPLGNVIIIQESKTNDEYADPFSWIPDDSPAGGSILFEFEPPVTLTSFGLLDLDEDAIFPIVVTYSDGTSATLEYVSQGNNGAFSVLIDKSNVISAEIQLLRSSGAVSSVEFCREEDC